MDVVEIVLVLDLPPAEVPWESHPRGTAWLVDALRLDKGGFAYWWRPHGEPVGNHRIKEPVCFWSCEGGIEEETLNHLQQRRHDQIPRPLPDTTPRQRTVELERALHYLRQVHGAYWERGWRGEHRGDGRYPEHSLWEAVQGYLDLLEPTGEASTEPG